MKIFEITFLNYCSKSSLEYNNVNNDYIIILWNMESDYFDILEATLIRHEL